MINRAIFRFLPLIALSIAFSDFALSEDSKLAENFAVVDGPYKLKSEIGIFGFITQRSGGKVLFQPCQGEAKEISASELEETKNTCADGGGQSFASMCQDKYQIDFPALLVESDVKNWGIGNIYETSGREIKAEGRSVAIYAKRISRLKACDNGWTIAYDQNGDMITQMLAIDPRLLKDSSDPVWR